MYQVVNWLTVRILSKIWHFDLQCPAWPDPGAFHLFPIWIYLHSHNSDKVTEVWPRLPSLIGCKNLLLGGYNYDSWYWLLEVCKPTHSEHHIQLLVPRQKETQNRAHCRTEMAIMCLKPGSPPHSFVFSLPVSVFHDLSFNKRLEKPYESNLFIMALSYYGSVLLEDPPHPETGVWQ